MSEHDDLRRALEELSSHPPHRDRKRVVHQRIGVVRRRNQVVGGVAASVVILLTGIVFASLGGGGGGARNDALVQSPIVTPTPAPSPAPSPPSSAPAAASAPVTKRTAAKSPAVDAGSPGRNIATAQTTITGPPAPTSASGGAAGTKPANPGTAATAGATAPTTPASIPPATPPASSRPAPTKSASTAPTSSGGSGSMPPTGTTTPAGPSGDALSADISATTAGDGSAAPDTVVTVRVHGTITGSIGSITAWYTTTHHVGYTDSQSRACAVQDGKLHDVDDTFTFRTRYRAAGTQRIDALVTTADPTCATDAATRDWPFAATVDIKVGSSLSNGVAPVTLTVGAATVQGSRITLSAAADDPDGYVSSFSVNWGSGAPDTFPGGNGANCSATEYGGAFWPSGGGSGMFTSPVLPAGTYSVTVTATSTGCDLGDPQSVQQKLTVVIP